MKRDVVVVLAGACLLSLLTPAPALALWGGGWLERLSGPGPFLGHVVDARLLCIAAPGKGPQAGRTDPTIGDKVTVRLSDRAWLTPAGCHMLGRDDQRVEFGVDVGILGSRANVLDYTHRGLGEADTAVNLRTFMVTGDLRVNRVVDVGAAIGVASFGAERDDLFRGFSRLVLQPLRITARPLALVSDSRKTEAVTLRFDATKFNGRFTAEDFGARPGTFNEPGEITWAWSIRVDPFAFFW